MRYRPQFSIYRNLLLSALFFIFFCPAAAQDTLSAPLTDEERKAELSRELDALAADVLPQFPRGEEAMAAWIHTHLNIPYVALRNDSTVMVYVDFLVERTGYITDVAIKYPGVRQLDKEVVQLFKGMPRWKPGLLNGKPVDLRMTLPLRITIPNSLRKPAEVATPAVSSLPQFSGGGQALRYYIKQNMQYPKEARAAGITGAITVEFLILANGRVGNPATMGEVIGYGLEEEAMRLVEKMPKWIPAKLDGKAVTTKHQIVIRFEPPGKS
ncbi:TonB family protein [Chitinophaga lutea]|uniref:TonB family protein n=1 Tax=Chitinophaga lutea TaxID=2488634 RepID=A0A3N4PX04_9BACT|nr:energy transducer TonB [Chitinophaga lutea]RPE09661.1 TonB family protein [Chitinophaga lutea]